MNEAHEALLEVIDGEDFDPFSVDGYEAMVNWLSRDGDLRTPCSRYGYSTSGCVDWAIAVLYIYIDANGSPDAPISDFLEHAIGLVVNDHDDPLNLVIDHSHVIADSDTIDGLLDDADDLLYDELQGTIRDLTLDAKVALRRHLRGDS